MCRCVHVVSYKSCIILWGGGGFYRKEAVPLVDAFDIPDGQLNSALGRYDGDVYKHLFDWALKAPRNKEKVRTCVYV